MRVRLGVAVSAALLVNLLTGCSGDHPAASVAAVQTGAPWFDEIEPAGSAGRVELCALPVRFELADRWLAKPVKLDGGPFDSLARQGDATLACEVDAKPAGHLGFLRIWVVARTGDGPRPALEQFLAADRGLSATSYRDLTVDGMAAVEATYLRESPLVAGGKRERALAVAAPQGLAVLTLSGLDSDQYQAMLPAYALARRSLAPAA